MATKYFYRVFVADPDDQDHARNQQVSFDTTFIVAGSGPTAQDHDVELEQDGRNELIEITTFKQFATVVNTSAKMHTVHTLFLLEQTEVAVATKIEFYQWDDNVKRDKKGNASLIKLASIVMNSKIARHAVTRQEDAYWFHFEVTDGAEYDDIP
jgi:hypothetical protein